MSQQKYHPNISSQLLALTEEISVDRNDDTIEGRRKKYLIHRQTHEVINHSIATQNYVAAYLLAFSLLEDRIRAMYVVLIRDFRKQVIKETTIRQRISEVIKTLHQNNEITSEEKNQLTKLFYLRNKLAHSSMWHLHTFRPSDVQDVMSMYRKISNLTERLKRRAKKKSH